MIKSSYHLVTAVKRQLQTPYTKSDILVIAMAISIASLFALSDAPTAEKIIAVFGAIIVVLRTGSFLCFVLATICLVNIITLSIIGNELLAEAFAVYVFYFMFIGAISLMLENNPNKKYAAFEAKLKRK